MQEKTGTKCPPHTPVHSLQVQSTCSPVPAVTSKTAAKPEGKLQPVMGRPGRHHQYYTLLFYIVTLRNKEVSPLNFP